MVITERSKKQKPLMLACVAQTSGGNRQERRLIVVLDSCVLFDSFFFFLPIALFSRSASLVAQTVKRLPAMRENWVRFLGQEDLEKDMAIHSSTLAWKIPWTEEPDRLQSMESQRVRHD